MRHDHHATTSLALLRRYRVPLLSATGAIAAIAITVSTWAQNTSQTDSAPAQAAPVSEAISNVPAPQGQVDPQAMVTAAPHQPPADPDGATSSDPLVRGAYLARAGDCVACHTAPGSQPFAGGLAMASPLGTIYSSNITPDKDSGIGSYSFEDFDRAVRHGVSPGKGSLYPAMPYPSYAQVSAQDMQDLYAYFMQQVPPVASTPPANGIPWPLSMRWPLGLWRALFAPNADKVQRADGDVAPDADPLVRGAYLVQGLGHCGACHTPRAVTMQEKALNDSDPQFLSGGSQPMDGWIATNLRGNEADGLGRWSTQDIADLLRTGRNAHSAVFGGMTDVVRHSTQYLSTADLNAIAAYLKSLSASPQHSAAPRFVPSNTTAQALWNGDTSAPGAALYLDNCAACHRSDGRGYEQVFPALAGNSALLMADPHNLVTILLRGHQLAATDTRPSTFSMPGFGWRLNDQEAAELASFVRNSWGNQASAVSASDVARARKQAPEENTTAAR